MNRATDYQVNAILEANKSFNKAVDKLIKKVTRLFK